MTGFIDIDADNVVGIRIDGKISEQEFDAITARLEEKMSKHSTVRIYAEIKSLGGMSPETFFKDLKFGLQNWDRFDKEALVTDKKWLEKIIDISDHLFPSIEVEAFSFDEKKKAKIWIQN
ncbi:STAS/SEC14 domain-containing protein [Rhodohalobacter sp. 614A]|uniref:STAS/SEC14 domain-containing protein n=1 Tax=Rhodohalobacter sp. 614A TaxID=2908649 RepID=UPI001F1C63A7|nr:STAS/SEC14 domain-containing protein [Rhodohalobacter sp. 614A]